VERERDRETKRGKIRILGRELAMEVILSPSTMRGMMNLGSAFCRANAAWYSFCRLFGVGDFSSALSLNLGVQIYLILKIMTKSKRGDSMNGVDMQKDRILC
jgi:hypothetical protein